METRMMKQKRISTQAHQKDKPLITIDPILNKPPPLEKAQAKASTTKDQPEKEKEKARTPKGGYKALAATAVRQGTAVAARLLDVKKKASPPI